MTSDNEVPKKVKYTSLLIDDIGQRLDIGAEKYGMQVPIEDSDGRIFTQEAYEELCDAIVYLSSIGLNLISKAHDDEQRYHAHMMGNILFNTCYQTIKYMELIYDKKTI